MIGSVGSPPTSWHTPATERRWHRSLAFPNAGQRKPVRITIHSFIHPFSGYGNLIKLGHFIIPMCQHQGQLFRCFMSNCRCGIMSTYRCG